jgi:hypothetical protein
MLVGCAPHDRGNTAVVHTPAGRVPCRRLGVRTASPQRERDRADLGAAHRSRKATLENKPPSRGSNWFGMATCSYCQQQKGKRSCPALGGMVCASCCGQHRLGEIDCPSDCTYLGGLSVVRDPAKATAGFTRAEYETTWEKLHAYAQGVSAFRNAALARCFVATSEPEPWEMDLATGYLFYGHRDADGRRLIDHFLTARGRGLSPGEAVAVVALQRTWASLFEVVSVQTGIGLELRDLVSGEIVAVREVSASGQLKKWDVLFMWLMTASDHVELTGAAVSCPGSTSTVYAKRSTPSSRMHAPRAPAFRTANWLARSPGQLSENYDTRSAT